MHYNCFNSLVDKPLQKIQDKDSYVCIPCANFATQKSEEENENEIEHKEITKGKKNVIVQNESEEEKGNLIIFLLSIHYIYSIIAVLLLFIILIKYLFRSC